jgi:hypothetical protein
MLSIIQTNQLATAIILLAGGASLMLLSGRIAKGHFRRSELAEAGDDIGKRPIWTMRFVDMSESTVRLIYRAFAGVSIVLGVVALLWG